MCLCCAARLLPDARPRLDVERRDAHESGVIEGIGVSAFLTHTLVRLFVHPLVQLLDVDPVHLLQLSQHEAAARVDLRPLHHLAALVLLEKHRGVDNDTQPSLVLAPQNAHLLPIHYKVLAQQLLLLLAAGFSDDEEPH